MFFVCANHPAWGPRKASFANTSLGASFQVGHVSAFPLISFRCGARTAYLEGDLSDGLGPQKDPNSGRTRVESGPPGLTGPPPGEAQPSSRGPRPETDID